MAVFWRLARRKIGRPAFLIRCREMIAHHGAYCDGTLLPTQKHFSDDDAYLIDVKNSMIDRFLLVDIKNDGKKYLSDLLCL